MHGSEGARSEEAGIVDGGAVLQEVLKAVDLADELENLGVTGVCQRVLLALLPKNVEQKVLEVGLDHVELRLVEGFVVLDIVRGGISDIVFHGGGNQVAGTGLKGAVENFQVQEVGDGIGLVLGG